jgi:hypothetical protein
MEDFLVGEGVGRREKPDHTMSDIGIELSVPAGTALRASLRLVHVALLHSHEEYCVLSAFSKTGKRMLWRRG